MYDDFGEDPGGFDSYADFKASGKTASKDLYQGEEYVTRLTDDNWDEKVSAFWHHINVQARQQRSHPRAFHVTLMGICRFVP
jgi:hypothetical protein